MKQIRILEGKVVAPEGISIHTPTRGVTANISKNLFYHLFITYNMLS